MGRVESFPEDEGAFLLGLNARRLVGDETLDHRLHAG
jgi:hypothetical protein